MRAIKSLGLVSLFLACLLSFIPKRTYGQVLSALNYKSKMVYLNVIKGEKSEHFKAGYAQTIHLRFMDKLGLHKFAKHDITLFTDVFLRTTQNGWHNAGFTYGAQTDLIHAHQFRIPFKKTFFISEFYNNNYNASSFGAGFEFMPGYYGKRLTLAGFFAYQHIFKSYIHLKTEAPKTPLPNDGPLTFEEGWHKHIGGHLQFGVWAGYRFSRFETTMQVIYQKPLHNDIIPISPIYVSLGINYRFGKGEKNNFEKERLYPKKHH